MSASAILDLVDTDEYRDLDTAARVAKLNTWKVAYKSCVAKDLTDMMSKYLLQGKMEIEREKRNSKIYDGLWVRWRTMCNIIENPNAVLWFNTEPLLLAKMFDELYRLGILEDYQRAQIFELGTTRTNDARMHWKDDMTTEILEEIESLRPMYNRIKERRKRVDAEKQRLEDELKSEFDYMNEREQSTLRLIANPDKVPVWVNAKSLL